MSTVWKELSNFPSPKARPSVHPCKHTDTYTLHRNLCSTRWDFTFVIAPLLQLLPRWSLSGLKMVTLHCTICWVRTTCKQTVCRDVSTQDTQTDPDTHTHTHGGKGLQRVVEDSFPENLHGSLLIFRLFGQHEMECLIFKFAHLNQAVSTIFFSPPPPLLGHATRAPTFRHVVVVAPRGFALPFAAPGEKWTAIGTIARMERKAGQFLIFQLSLRSPAAVWMRKKDAQVPDPMRRRLSGGGQFLG